MKYVGFILIAVIMGLVFVPCADGSTCMENDVEMTHHGDHDHDDETHDCGCSPFCFCDCCQVHFINFSFEQTTLFVPQGIRHHFVYVQLAQTVFQSVHFPPPQSVA